ncbi:Cyclic pyranopterin monophosphate synthase [Corynebacterium pseudopelargi]|uniref:GTP 3',8-cyclase n=2 Tax=Corynebacterium pseudopelargi TaxID=2080757 RepID=A0A3G6IUP4_9CORY|nr:Cyclic pyranopterin monophosphate synthase [Corynebacterium pseudopelargi]
MTISLAMPTIRQSKPSGEALLDAGVGELRDHTGRVAKDLRVSLTDRCNLRCTYCMPEEGMEWIPTEEVLSDEEVIRLIRIGVQRLGIEQVRFTGGEPLLRRSLEHIIAETAALTTRTKQKPTIALTSNALGLDKRAEALAHAGLDRVNLSLDTLNPQRYKALTRRDRLADAIKGIEAAIDAGLKPVKINTVVMKGVNEDDVLPLARFALEHRCQLRFIEQMPIGPREQWRREDMVTAEAIIATLGTELSMTPSSKPRGSAPAALWQVQAKDDAQLVGEIGVIASVTHPFCGDCDRTRLTTDGAIRNCLFAHAETSLRDLMRDGASDAELAEAWAQAMWPKAYGHGINDPSFVQPERTMSAIGG